ncbi:hypothetical protein [Phaeobacter sp. J2-8]|uniref:hypothetical protein n=1 Tax=Phaeobacter sp. J2-8 TaxID=2931394 RepID=UPI001FD60094|nr:hypothetical protein [Phaeobacter sp. J2-8]MCJ7874722.1 hypothetical protein [Phaeobacter sp. J2-8]
MAYDLEFGFRPLAMDVIAGPITIETLDGLEDRVAEVEQSDQKYQDWIYSPRQKIKHLGTGEIYYAPYAARVFGLPNTHIIRHIEDVGLGHLQFHIWSLGFFTGQRLSATEAGFLDATPLKPGKLNDFELLGDSLPKAVQLAEAYWLDNMHDRKQLARFEAAIHALFLAQNPRLLQFEAFMFLYTALDACFKMMKESLSGPHPRTHGERTIWMCEQYGVPVPEWAEPDGGTEIADLRNPAIHEGLYVGEPLGFAVEGQGANRNLNLQMQAVVCRLLVAIVGGAETDYVKSDVTSRQRHGLRLP